MQDAGDVEFVFLRHANQADLIKGFCTGSGDHAGRANAAVAEIYDLVAKDCGELTVIVGLLDGEAIAVSAYRAVPLHPIEGLGTEAYIHIVAVRHDLQRQGVGRRLVLFTIAAVTSAWGHTPDIWTFVSPANYASQQLFKSLSFALIEPASEGGSSIRTISGPTAALLIGGEVSDDISDLWR
jgi:ribosomal protein S18 acetylase RimI-like enzyme